MLDRMLDFSISRQTVTRHLLKRGQNARAALLKFYHESLEDKYYSTANIIDYWRGRHSKLRGYGGTMVCTIDPRWHWLNYPVVFETLSKEDGEVHDGLARRALRDAGAVHRARLAGRAAVHLRHV